MEGGCCSALILYVLTLLTDFDHRRRIILVKPAPHGSRSLLHKRTLPWARGSAWADCSTTDGSNGYVGSRALVARTRCLRSVVRTPVLLTRTALPRAHPAAACSGPHSGQGRLCVPAQCMPPLPNLLHHRPLGPPAARAAPGKLGAPQGVCRSDHEPKSEPRHLSSACGRQLAALSASPRCSAPTRSPIDCGACGLPPASLAQRGQGPASTWRPATRTGP